MKKLERSEMKNLKGGLRDPGASECGELCSTDAHCSANTTCPKCISGAAPNGGCGCGKGATPE